jgi:hypothetical protein
MGGRPRYLFRVKLSGLIWASWLKILKPLNRSGPCPPRACCAAEVGQVDHRCDVWAVGILLYHCVVGAPPFGRVADDTPSRRAGSGSQVEGRAEGSGRGAK